MKSHINKGAVLKILETEIKVFGIPYSDTKFILAEGLAIILIPTLLDIFGYALGSLFYLFMVALLVATIIMLRRMSRHKYKSYAVSVVQFRLWQPKLIRVTKSE
ncbi:MAG: hypothetical protein LBK47_06685 [Prevotellaceae bacterium]|jgi:hypothetical protein|nr:hypothetical protein [Prevotellaceae bacterium]